MDMRKGAGLAMLTTLLGACAPAQKPAATATAAATTEARGQRADFASDRITVEVIGSGPDVILIPGLSSSPDVWRSTVAAVPGYRYHLIQVKGFAGAAAEANATGPLVEPVAHAIHDYIAAKALKSPAVVGHSMGGSIGMTLASHHPEDVGRLMIVDMFPFMGAMFGGPTATPDGVRPIAEQVRKGIASQNGDARKAQTEATIASMIATEARRPQAVQHALDSDPATSGQGMYDLITTDLRPGMARYTGPVTVLYVYPPNAPIPEAVYNQFMTASFAGVKQARIVKVPDSRHFIMWDAPAAFQAELKGFLAAK